MSSRPEADPQRYVGYVNERIARNIRGPLMNVSIDSSLGADGSVKYVARGSEPEGNPFGIETEEQPTPAEALMAVSDSLVLQKQLKDSARLNRLLEEIKEDHDAGEIDYDIDSLMQLAKVIDAFDINTKRELYMVYDALLDMAEHLGVHVLDLFKDIEEQHKDPESLPERPED